jgi:F0F1-type ATP synthase assembly protein I
MSDDPTDDDARNEQNAAFHALGLVIAGVFFWGGIGWLVARWLDSRIFILVGTLAGVGAALYLVWVRYGRS